VDDTPEGPTGSFISSATVDDDGKFLRDLYTAPMVPAFGPARTEVSTVPTMRGPGNSAARPVLGVERVIAARDLKAYRYRS
jgi:hypothetical protein